MGVSFYPILTNLVSIYTLKSPLSNEVYLDELHSFSEELYVFKVVNFFGLPVFHRMGAKLVLPSSAQGAIQTMLDVSSMMKKEIVP